MTTATTAYVAYKNNVESESGRVQERRKRGRQRGEETIGRM